MQKDDSALYFVALIPSDLIRSEVKAFKEWLKEKYGVKHALKSPAHITLQRPFRRAESFEDLLINKLEIFAQMEEPFKIKLNGFSCFNPRVIFINPQNLEPIQKLHKGLTNTLMQLDFNSKEMNENIHPHMTIAIRDLTEEHFHTAWSKFKDKPYKAAFEAKSIYLLKHNGKYWDIYREFIFK